MAASKNALAPPASAAVATKLDAAQTIKASTALLRKIQSDKITAKDDSEKKDLLSDADDEDAEDEVPVWLVLTTKKHVVDKKRLKPGKIVLPHPYLDTADDNLRICLITADPQRTYKDLVAHPSFPVGLSKRIHRVIGITKLKAKYKSFESRRQLLSEYDVFLADDRIITSLPNTLGKVFYKSSSKRPIPIALEGKRQSIDEQGNKRRKLAEGGTKVIKAEVKPTDVAHEIQRTLSAALVHLSPSTTTSIRVGKATHEPEQLQANIESAVEALVEKYVPQKWSNVRAIHIKGPKTAALPIWMTSELWEDERDVLEEAPPPVLSKKEKKKRKRALIDGEEERPDVIEVPGSDGKMRKVERPGANKRKGEEHTDGKKSAKKIKGDEEVAKAAEKAEKEARKEALKKQKEVAKAAVVKDAVVAKPVRKTRVKAADLN